jgi:hypothetical protein
MLMTVKVWPAGSGTSPFVLTDGEALTAPDQAVSTKMFSAIDARSSVVGLRRSMPLSRRALPGGLALAAPAMSSEAGSTWFVQIFFVCAKAG